MKQKNIIATLAIGLLIAGTGLLISGCSNAKVQNASGSVSYQGNTATGSVGEVDITK